MTHRTKTETAAFDKRPARIRSRIHWIIIGVAILMAAAYVSQADGTRTDQAAPLAHMTEPSSVPTVDPSLVLKDLVQTHPRKEIREDLDRLIETGEVALNFEELARAQNSLATILLLDDSSTGRETYVFNFSAERILDTSASKAFKQLVVFHEWIHLRQQIEQRAPKWIARGMMPKDKEQVHALFEAEMEAYEAECRLAVELKHSKEFFLCVAYERGGSEKLRSELATQLAVQPAFSLFGITPQELIHET